jgi:hypothetical protein
MSVAGTKKAIKAITAICGIDTQNQSETADDLDRSANQHNTGTRAAGAAWVARSFVARACGMTPKPLARKTTATKTRAAARV